MLIKAGNSNDTEPAEVYEEFYEIYRNASDDFRFVQVAGHHHVHLTNPELVAPHAYNFLRPLQSNL